MHEKAGRKGKKSLSRQLLRPSVLPSSREVITHLFFFFRDKLCVEARPFLGVYTDITRVDHARLPEKILTGFLTERRNVVFPREIEEGKIEGAFLKNRFLTSLSLSVESHFCRSDGTNPPLIVTVISGG